MTLEQTVEQLRTALVSVTRFGPHANIHGFAGPAMRVEVRGGYVSFGAFNGFVSDALAALTEAQQREQELQGALEKATATAGNALVVRDSYQAAWQRIGSALVKAGFEDDTTEAAVASALAEVARLTAENAELRAASSSSREPQKDETALWAVSVERNGEPVVTISSNLLAGRDLSEDDERVIETAARHLLAFLGVPAEKESK